MAKMTEAAIALLAKGFCGPRPGANIFYLTELRVSDGTSIDGETIDALTRSGLLVAEPKIGAVDTIKGGDAGPYGEIPDISITHRYRLSDLGRSTLSGRGDPE